MTPSAHSDSGFQQNGFPGSNGLPGDQVGSTDGARFLAFGVGDWLYAIAVESVIEIIQPIPITPLPNAPENLSGIVLVRGEIAAAIDLRFMLAVDSVPVGTKSKMVVIKGGSLPLAFTVDRIFEVIEIPGVEAASASAGDPLFVMAKATHDGAMVRIIDPLALQSQALAMG